MNSFLPMYLCLYVFLYVFIGESANYCRCIFLNFLNARTKSNGRSQRVSELLCN